MKSLRVLLPLALLSLSTAALAQSDAQKSFDNLKNIAGEWEGVVTVVPPMPGQQDVRRRRHLRRRLSRSLRTSGPRTFRQRRPVVGLGWARGCA